jgi:hypothetical protein
MSSGALNEVARGISQVGYQLERDFIVRLVNVMYRSFT